MEAGLVECANVAPLTSPTLHQHQRQHSPPLYQQQQTPRSFKLRLRPKQQRSNIRFNSCEMSCRVFAPILCILAALMVVYVVHPALLPPSFSALLDAIFYEQPVASPWPRSQSHPPHPSSPAPPPPDSAALPPPPPPTPSPPPPAPCPAMPPPPLPRPVVDQLNDRFRLGAPSNDPDSAGVLVHQFDGQEDYTHGWNPCTSQSINDWCTKYSDRFASSLINKRVPFLFNTAGGMVFRMAADNQILCAMSGDGGTMSVVCDPPGVSNACVPGCWSCLDESNQPIPSCQPTWCTESQPWQCGWKPSELQGMLMQQEANLIGSACVVDGKCYNEVIVDTETFEAHLPHSLEAFFFLSTSSMSDEAHAREVHSSFLASYAGLVTAHAVPLLKLTLSNDEPFSCVICV